MECRVLVCVLRNYLLLASTGLLALSSPVSMSSAATPLNRTVGTDISAKDSTATLDPKVTVTTDKSRYLPGERINVVVRNDSFVPVFVPGMTDACSVVVVEHQASSIWISEGVCIPVGTIQRIEIEPDQRLDGFLSPEGKTFWVLSHTPAPAPIPPAASWPYQPSTNLLPSARPVVPASSTTTVPEGERPPGPPHPPFHRLTAALGHGTYRVGVSYSGHGLEGMVQIAHSAPFVVTGGDAVPARE